MEYETYIAKKKEICSSLLDFIENSDSSDLDLRELFDNFQETAFFQNKEEILSIFQFLSKIIDNHHITSYFFTKLEHIYEKLIPYKETFFTDSEIIQIYKENKRSLFFLISIKFINPDQYIIDLLVKGKNYYFYPVLKTFIDSNTKNSIETEITTEFSIPIDEFEKKCQNGENDTYISTLIREDSVEEFISFVTKNIISLSSTLKPSFYETNQFLLNEKQPSIIEYAFFNGSIQIIQYLKYNNVSFDSSLWLYAIHSNNAELIHLLEDNKIESNSNNNSFEIELKEAIKCHHNNIADYIKDNLLNQSLVISSNGNELHDKFDLCIMNSFNFYYFPNNLGSIIMRGKMDNKFNIDQLCKSVTKIIIPSGITKIGKYAFNNLPKLNEISIPNTIKKVGHYVFDDIKILNITGNIKNILQCMFYRYESITQITLPFSVTSINKYAFAECPLLFQITIPSSIVTIDEGAFYECSSLKVINYVTDGSKTNLVIPFQLRSIESNTYFNCVSLEKVDVPPFATKIGNYALAGCSSITSLSIPPTIELFGDYSFFKCSSLKEISIPSKMRIIKEGTFYKCSSLIEITIPSSINSIESFAFADCSSLIKVLIPSSVNSIGNHSFDGCSKLKEISIPSSVKSIGHNSFSRCSSLEEIEIPSSVKNIGNCAFDGCSSLTQISIPSSIDAKQIGLSSKVKINLI